MPEITLFYNEKGSKFQKIPLEKGVLFNSQNYDGYPLLMALPLPGYGYHTASHSHLTLISHFDSNVIMFHSQIYITLNKVSIKQITALRFT